MLVQNHNYAKLSKHFQFFGYIWNKCSFLVISAFKSIVFAALYIGIILFVTKYFYCTPQYLVSFMCDI